ncbi:hypothetical protein LTS08_008418 [Lithohypha guttulata]|nr:hypothetical protein LTS08_008418 [Lithohypha guttulata]
MRKPSIGLSFATLITIIAKIIDFADALGRKFTEGREYRRIRFGSIRGEIWYWLGLLNTEEVQRVHFNINLWSKEEVCAWKDAYVSRCSAICVAAAIFASIGQSALGLDGMRETHWSASALLTASMALGILAVCAAVSLQNSVTGLSNHKDIRLWLSKGLSKDYYEYPEPYKGLLMESSASTVKLMEAPQLLLNLSVAMYFLGFGLYLLYAWIWAVEEPTVNFRNNFIFYVCVSGAVIAYIAFLWSGRILDQDKVNLQFNLKRRFDTGATDKKMDMLEKWSEIVEVLTTSRSEFEKAEARRGMDEMLSFMRYNFDSPNTKDGYEPNQSRQGSPAATGKELTES